MAFEVTPLPYADTALAPAISAETLSFHHGKHHKAYVDKTNAAIEGTDHADKSLEEVIAAARGSDQGLFNNSAQSWNHGFYWHSMAAEGGKPTDELKTMIDDSFGSVDELKTQATGPRRRPFRQRLGLAGRKGRQADHRGNA